jgi:hypothetical protein
VAGLDDRKELVMRRILCVVMGVVLVLGALAGALGWTATSLLRAGPGEWSHPVRWGPWRFDASVPALVRVATHPVLLQHFAGRTVATPFGPVRWQAGAQPHHWQVVCAPCRVRLPELGHDDVVLARVELDAHRFAQDDWRGDFMLGDARSVRGRWKASFGRTGAKIEATLPDTPLADVFALFANDIPEVRRASIDGRLRLAAQLALPQRTLSVKTGIEGFVVSGLGTEALLDAQPGCAAPPKRGFGAWLPRAVVAAEDQRFHEHPGYDLREIDAAWSLNQQEQGAARGGSTITQQLAKLLYTGGERHHLRKLRELLYAVEMDRTLGKARVLQLYLAIAPWGDGQCGAAAASRHYLHKRVDLLTPTEAAWLASLLRAPDRDWARYEQSGAIDVERVRWVIAHLRPMNPERREALIEAVPMWSPKNREW